MQPALHLLIEVIKMELSNRKHPRLKEYDYSQNGCYFATICVKNRMHLLGSFINTKTPLPNVWEANPNPVSLSYVGEVTEKYIGNVNIKYDNITVDKYVIMPNHIHLLITFDHSNNNNGGMLTSSPTLHTVVRSLKTMVTKTVGHPVWQESYYDRVIRNDAEFQETWKYIDENPLKWQEDELCI
jgi:REP element-mobilizing transposase RayT